jgi:hypothetical protein
MAVIDITTFRLAGGVDDDAFLVADERVRTGVLYRQPGVVRSTTARGDDGEWAIVVLWRSEPSTDVAASELADVIEPGTVTRRQYRTLD